MFDKLMGGLSRRAERKAVDNAAAALRDAQRHLRLLARAGRALIAAREDGTDASRGGGERRGLGAVPARRRRGRTDRAARNGGRAGRAGPAVASDAPVRPRVAGGVRLRRNGQRFRPSQGHVAAAGHEPGPASAPCLATRPSASSAAAGVPSWWTRAARWTAGPGRCACCPSCATGCGPGTCGCGAAGVTATSRTACCPSRPSPPCAPKGRCRSGWRRTWSATSPPDATRSRRRWTTSLSWPRPAGCPTPCWTRPACASRR